MRSLTLLVAGVALACSLAQAQVITAGLPNLLAGAPVTAGWSAGALGAKYGPQEVTDGKTDSHWAGDNKRLPQWVEIKLPTPRKLDTLTLQGANQPNLYANWQRVIIRFAAGEPLVQDFPDTVGPFLVRFPERTTDTIRLEILEVHDPDSVYVGISEVQAFLDPQERVKVRVSPMATWRAVDLTGKPRAEHPCVYHTRADVAAARERIKAEPWARAYADGVTASAEAALAKPEDWYRQVMPGKGACFAYGFTGCPICQGGWGTWGGARCSWDLPGKVTCERGHVLPDAEHPDPGTGHVNPDGRIHYFVGSWNAWVTEKLIHEFAGNCALAYAITGEEKYAARAAYILDLVADIYPSCDKGSWDYPSTPPSGRLARPWYQVARVLVRLVDFHDLIFHSPALDAPSVTPGLTRRQNIETNMLRNGAAYCYEQSLHGGLNNGEADYIRGSLAVGCLLGIEPCVRWAYDGPYGILALTHNNVCRDGRYFETSVSYSDHARELYLTFAEPLWNYRSEAYPKGINVYDDPVFRSFYVVPSLATTLVGHWPRYGDSGPDTGFTLPPKRPTSDFDQHLAEILYARSAGPTQREFGELVSFLAGGEVVKSRAGVPDKEWMLFHAGPPPTSQGNLPQWLQSRIFDTGFFGQKGLALLRSGRDRDAQGALVRFGPSLNHGHRDDLNLNYFALGHELTYDLGYGLGSTHTQVGWSHQTASHNLVLVNEASQGPDGAKDGSGGSLHLVAGMPGLQVADCSAEGTYRSQGVTAYRRLTALVGEGRETYLLDLFHVKGGKQHDYLLHSMSSEVAFEGVTPGAAEAGSLAGPDITWGALQGNDADMIGFPNRPYWNPPPGNGLGFLMEPQRAPAPATCSATWKLPGEHEPYLKLALLSEPDTELITAWAPGIYPERQSAYGTVTGYPRARYVVARRKGDEGLESTFAAVLEPYARPLPERTFDDEDLARVAKAARGEIKPIPSYGLLLYKATGPEDEMRLPLRVAKAGRYEVRVGVYGSPNYGTARLMLDGQELAPLVNEKGEAAAGGSVEVGLGLHSLQAGEHVFGVRVVKPVNGNYWIGLQYINLVPEGARAAEPQSEPFLADARRLPAAEGEARVEVTHRNGLVEELCWLRNGGGGAGLTRVTRQGDQLRAADLIAAAARLGGAEISLTTPAHEGAIARLDYRRNLLYSGAALPADGRLNGQPVYVSNPRYSRNTVHRIVSIRREGKGSVIDLGETSLILGFADLESEPLDEHVLLSLIPHEYSRALGRPDSGFFHGKLLATEDLKVATNVRGTTFGQPFRIEVDSTAGFSQGQRVYYHDVQAGDGFRIPNLCSLRRGADGTYRVQASDDVRVRGVKVAVSDGKGWKAAPQGLVKWHAGGATVRLW